ncbi:MAG: type I 3-dehydroquinate dehydratase [Thermoanaerobacteraceae bacterium]|nr:type I 3-dehydroquinate dehydratase [Thermoanaerobacteraceae bacterium]
MDLGSGHIFRNKPLICIPIAPHDLEDLKRQAEYAKGIIPDMVEFRADYYKDNNFNEALKYIAFMLPVTPVIFTFRKKEEGGVSEIKESERLDIILKAVSSGYMSILDIEESTEEGALKRVVDASRHEGIPVMMSYHDMKAVPPNNVLREKLYNIQDKGANAAKIAVTPRSKEEAFKFIETITEIKKAVNISTVVVTMGEHGMFLRLFGWVLESPIIYAAGLVHTAPGQPPAEYVRWLIQR